MATRVCESCGEAKPLDAFTRWSNRERYSKVCLTCAEVAREFRRIAEQEQARQRAQAWYWKNRERALAHAEEYYKANAENIKARARAWAAANRERKRETDRQWREKNRERTREYARAYRRGALQARPQKRAEIKAMLFDRDGGLCGLCGEPVDLSDCHTDHITPVALGGKPELTNLQLAHPRCNRVKGGRLS